MPSYRSVPRYCRGWACRWLLAAAACGLAGLHCAQESPQQYIDQFASMDGDVRRKAGNELIRFDADVVVPLLIERADHELVRVRFEVMRMLGRFGDARAVPVLIEALGDRSPRVAAMAAAALSMLRAPEAVPALLQYASDPSPVVREHVIGALGPCHDAAAAPALSDSARRVVLAALDANRPDVRIAALQSSRAFGYEGAVAQLMEMAADPSPEVRHVVVQALGELVADEAGRTAPAEIVSVDPYVRARIVTLLLQKLDTDEYQSIRTKAVRALAAAAADAGRAVSALEALRQHGTPEDQREATRALAALAPESASR